MGLNFGQLSSNISADYNHTHIGSCTNLNFGSEFPGEGCEGNQDYSTSYYDQVSGRTIGVSFEQLILTQQGIIGVQLNVSRASQQSVAFSETISQTWGDDLDVDVQVGATLDIRLIYGLPINEWMPFVAVGTGVQEVTTTYTQAHGGDLNYPSITETGTDWTKKDIWGIGLKRDIGNAWVLSVDLSQLRSKGAILSQDGTLLSGGIRYPETLIDSEVKSKEIRIGLSRRF